MAGPNGHGKTSLIEALVYAQVFRSFRGARDSEMVQFGADGFHIGIVLGGGREVGAGYDARTRQKKVVIDGRAPESLAAAIGVVRGVVLSPTDVGLITGGPKERRRYLDMLLALTERGYLDALGRYRRALAQRSRSTAAAAESFEEVLAEAGETIVAARERWAEAWQAEYARLCEVLGEQQTSALSYRPRTPGDAAALRDALSRSRDRDRELGHTSVGPHRDELRLAHGGRELRTYGSAGQQRTAALALRLIEAATMARTGAAPLLCLDDAFAELDADRCTRLGGLLEGLAQAGSQIVAAVPRETDIPEPFGGLERWNVREGVVTGMAA